MEMTFYIYFLSPSAPQGDLSGGVSWGLAQQSCLISSYLEISDRTRRRAPGSSGSHWDVCSTEVDSTAPADKGYSLEATWGHSL